MEAKLSGKNVVIKLPIDSLIYGFNFKEDNQELYKIKYKRKFAEGVVEYLNAYSSDSESGLTVFQELLDQIFEEMVCNDEYYIKNIEDQE